MSNKRYKAFFLDVGGVFLTNGWDRLARSKAVEKFHLDAEETDSRHHLMFDTYEIGKISLDDYLTQVVFYEKRPFTIEEFKAFMFQQSQPYPDMIRLIREFKVKHQLKTTVVSNEGKELTKHRVDAFHLREFIDAFVFSYSVHLRKPDAEIYQIALDTTQVDPHETIYIDDRSALVEIANRLGMTGIHHTTFETTRKALEELFL